MDYSDAYDIIFDKIQSQVRIVVQLDGHYDKETEDLWEALKDTSSVKLIKLVDKIDSEAKNKYYGDFYQDIYQKLDKLNKVLGKSVKTLAENALLYKVDIAKVPNEVWTKHASFFEEENKLDLFFVSPNYFFHI